MSIKTIMPLGMKWIVISIEVQTSRSLPSIDIIGLPDWSIKEAKDRIRSALRNAGVDIPPLRYVINLSPANIKKTWTSFDLALAIWLRCTITNHRLPIEDCLILGELALDWKVQGVPGSLHSVITWSNAWYKRYILPRGNVAEVSFVKWIEIYPVDHLCDILDAISTNKSLWRPIQDMEAISITHQETHTATLDEIVWHEIPKRGIAIAAAWMHNVLMIWPPWSGKSMLAKSIPSLLQPMSYEEILETSQIHSLAGKTSSQMPLVQNRPLRHIHHTISPIWLLGGGARMLPGEISLAHHGVLLLDELAEFPREILDMLRQPMEEKEIHISRAMGSATYPANCIVVGTMNPCICWYYKDSEKICICSPNSIKRYQSKISGPLLDRFDILLDVPRQSEYIYKSYQGWDSQNLCDVNNAVIKAINMQHKRFLGTGIVSNAHIPSKKMFDYINIDNECETVLNLAQKKLCLSHRAIHKTIKIARTIADIEESDTISQNHILEALQYRAKKYFI